MKRLVAILLALVMIFSLAACSGPDSDSDSGADNDSGSKNNGENNEESDIGSKYETVDGDDVTKLEDDDLSYVMIYNPKIYDENEKFDKSSLQSGEFGRQIDIDVDRADGLEEELKWVSFVQNELNKDLPWDKIDLEGNKGDGLSKEYRVGDTREFYCYSRSMNSRSLVEFECAYAGDYCHIWSDGSVSDSLLEDYGEEFDDEIFEEMVENFGAPRFAGDDGRVNILFYDIPYQGLLGLFTLYDLFATGEVSQTEIYQYGINTDHDILHINAEYAADSQYKSDAYSTMAHEFQHLICATNLFSTPNETMTRTWLNEAMSGYAEEMLYEGSAEGLGRTKSFTTSDLIRQGQSMYNFKTEGRDIGVYGSVYFFSEYLAETAGDSIFSKIHKYWRESYSKTLNEAEAIAESVPSSFKKKINNLLSYPKSYDFDNDNDEFMSKLILDFYLSYLSNKDDVDAFEKINGAKLCYDQLDGANIEGGGRIIVALKDSEFEIPEDADEGLVYIGLNQDFEVVGPIICK